MGIARQFINLNIALSLLIDKALPARLREDGNKFFLREMLPKALKEGATVYDLGGGSQPCISLEDKDQRCLTLVGLDISAQELLAAPEGVYDRTVAADLCTFIGNEDADIVVCQALLEHVPDTSEAMRAIASIVKPGGRAYLFVPSGNAVFARLNILLPESLKRRALFALFPHKALGHDGFNAYYDQCTPSKIEFLAYQNSMEVEECQLFWTSSYFRILTPVFIIWRLWQVLSYPMLGKDSAETFAYVLRKKDSNGKEA